ncbi:MAG: enoyl-CoA hydratase/isomerase family protein [Pseudomonadota bacterium]
MIEIERDGVVQLIWLNRPERRNAINREMIDGIRAGIDEASRDPNCRCVVIRGRGGTFSSGRDLGSTERPNGLPETLERDIAWTGIFEAMHGLEKPSVAIVEGYAVAGGFTLSMACDFVLASDDAYFGAFEMRNGFPAAINTPLLAKLGGPKRTLEWAMFGEPIAASALYAAGLINRLMPNDELEATAAAFIGTLSALDPDAVALTKQLHRLSLESPHGHSLQAGKYVNALLAASGRISEAGSKYRKKNS